MTVAGSGNATARMKSISPRSATRSSNPSTVAWMRSRLLFKCVGVNDFCSKLRSRV
jgi:hypothetical protein